MKFLISATAVLLTACATQGSITTPGHVVSRSDSTFLISQLTAGTWTAALASGRTPGVITPEQRGNLIAAIEKASGCRVTDSDISRQGMQLDAQVDCDSRLKN